MFNKKIILTLAALVLIGTACTTDQQDTQSAPPPQSQPAGQQPAPSGQPGQPGGQQNGQQPAPFSQPGGQQNGRQQAPFGQQGQAPAGPGGQQQTAFTSQRQGAAAENVQTAPGGTAALVNEVSISYDDTTMIVQSNGIPSHATGDFPNSTNPNTITAQNYTFYIPLNPQISSQQTELPMGPIGVTLAGVPFYNAFTHFHTYAVETETFDSCQGHPDQRGAYHYHQESDCVQDDFFGYALDGFQVWWQLESDGSLPTGLDACNGHEHDGIYHYHMTDDPSKPIMGCYSGTPDSRNSQQGPANQTQGLPAGQGQPQGSRQGQPSGNRP
ncbi:MAG: YHYH protein [Anaerolineae bacterium]|nr:YHYH protein [Anaerolineae bacterium]